MTPIDFSKALNEDPNVYERELYEDATSAVIANDIEAAKHDLMQFRDSVNAMQAEATALEVKDAASESQGAEMTAQVKKLKKQIEARQEEIIGEASKFVRLVQSFTLPFRKDLEAIEAQVKRKLGDYGFRKEQARRIAEEAARKAAAEAQAQIDAEAKAANVEPVVLPVPVVPKQSETIRTESGSTSYAKSWKYTVVDKSKIPARYLVEDPTDRAKVMESIRAGVREIPGLFIEETMIVKTR